VQSILSAGDKGDILLHSAFQLEAKAVGMHGNSVCIGIRQSNLQEDKDTVVSSHLKVGTLAAMQKLSVHIHTEVALAGMLEAHIADAHSALVVVVNQQALGAAANRAYEGVETYCIAPEGELGLRVSSPRVIVVATADHRHQYTYYI
jgi:hypothetical protein